MTTSRTRDPDVTPVSDVSCTGEELVVRFEDGRVLHVPLSWYPRLANGTPVERAKWEMVDGGYGIHWPVLDEDISVEGLLAGRRSGESDTSFARWLAARALRVTTARANRP